MWASTVLVRRPTSGGCWSLQKWDLNYSMQTPARVGGRQLCGRSLRCLWSPCSLSEASFAGVDQLQDSAIFLSIYPSPRVLLQNGHHLWWHPHWPSSWMLERGLSSTILAPYSPEDSFLDDMAMLYCLLGFLAHGRRSLGTTPPNLWPMAKNHLQHY